MIQPLELQAIPSIQATMFPLLESYPPLNQCLGSIDWNEIAGLAKYLLWPNRNPHVSKTIDYITSRSEFQAQIKAFSSDPQHTFVSFFQYLKQRPDQDYQHLCSVYQDHLMPLIYTAVKPEVERLLAHSNGCCEDLKADLGQDLSVLIELFAKTIGNSICSIQESTTCGQVFIQSFLQGNWAKTIWDLIQFMEIPNEEACKAFVGDSFQTTRGKKGRFTHPIDSCAAPIDRFVSQVSQIPFIQQFEAVNQLFQPDQCLSLQDIINMMEKYNIGKDMIGILKNFLGGKCFHIPNSYTNQCSFQNSLHPKF